MSKTVDRAARGPARSPAECAAGAAVPFETTIEVRDGCLCLHVQRAARALARRFDEAFRPLGLTNGQFSLLMSLNRPEPPSMGAVAPLLAMDRTTLTAALKPLQRRGLIEVAANPRDKRGRLLVLTPEGGALLARGVPIWRRTHAEVEAELPQGGGAGLLRPMLAALSLPVGEGEREGTAEIEAASGDLDLPRTNEQ
jgi:DNA-binding MarR family transcriptional regulator